MASLHSCQSKSKGSIAALRVIHHSQRLGGPVGWLLGKVSTFCGDLKLIYPITDSSVAGIMLKPPHGHSTITPFSVLATT